MKDFREMSKTQQEFLYFTQKEPEKNKMAMVKNTLNSKQ